jgi:hypothetical protein
MNLRRRALDGSVSGNPPERRTPAAMNIHCRHIPSRRAAAETVAGSHRIGGTRQSPLLSGLAFQAAN